ncbi:Dynamitin-domain-containing protein, partial [Cunninghamella echinulata]
PTSLINTLSKLEQQISLLAQPRHLDVISRKIKVLNSELERLHELKSGNTNKDDQGVLSNDTEEKVNQLFATMEKVDPLLNLTPTLLTRLKALQGLHTEAATFGKSVKLISEEQTRMTEEIKSLDTTCDLVIKNKNNEKEKGKGNIIIKVVKYVYIFNLFYNFYLFYYYYYYYYCITILVD